MTISYTGYSVWNFILLYLIGRWIYLYPNRLSKMQNSKLIVFLSLSVAVTFILSLWWLNKGHIVSDKTIFAYSSPWVISSSVLLFLCFKNINLSYNWVGSIAPSVLSVYLIHENSLIHQWIYIKPLRKLIAFIPSDIISYLMLLVYGIVLFLLIVAFDKLVRVKLQERILGVLSKLEIYQVFDSNLKKLN